MIQVQRSVVTNPAKEGLVSITSSSSDLGDYLRKVNSIKTLDAKEEKELAIKAKNGDNWTVNYDIIH